MCSLNWITLAVPYNALTLTLTCSNLICRTATRCFRCGQKKTVRGCRLIVDCWRIKPDARISHICCLSFPWFTITHRVLVLVDTLWLYDNFHNFRPHEQHRNRCEGRYASNMPPVGLISVRFVCTCGNFLCEWYRKTNTQRSRWQAPTLEQHVYMHLLHELESRMEHVKLMMKNKNSLKHIITL